MGKLLPNPFNPGLRIWCLVREKREVQNPKMGDTLWSPELQPQQCKKKDTVWGVHTVFKFSNVTHTRKEGVSHMPVSTNGKCGLSSWCSVLCPTRAGSPTWRQPLAPAEQLDFLFCTQPGVLNGPVMKVIPCDLCKGTGGRWNLLAFALPARSAGVTYIKASWELCI